MAMSGVVIPEMAAAAGLLPSTVDRIIRDLRAAGMAPMGQHGRGQTHGQFDQFHLANLLLAFAAQQPSGSADAVRALNGLRHEWWGEGLLRNDLADEIERRARLIRAGGKCLDLLEHGFELTLCLEPIEAWTVLQLEDGSENRQRWIPETTPPWLPGFAPPPEPRRGICRLTIITVDAMNTAAKLYADTIERRSFAETENAALAGAALTQDRETIPTTYTREIRREKKTSQAPSKRGPGPSQQTRSTHDEQSPPSLP